MKSKLEILNDIARSYSIRGQAKARAKEAGKLVSDSIRHSGKSSTVKVGETYEVPAGFAFSDAEKTAIATVDALERFTKLTGFTVEHLKEAAKQEAPAPVQVESEGAKVDAKADMKKAIAETKAQLATKKVG
jgi:hypothetical protein